MFELEVNRYISVIDFLISSKYLCEKETLISGQIPNYFESYLKVAPENFLTNF